MCNSDQIGNKGAFVKLTRNSETGKIERDITSFSHVPHPNVKPMAYAGAFGQYMAN